MSIDPIVVQRVTDRINHHLTPSQRRGIRQAVAIQATIKALGLQHLTVEELRQVLVYLEPVKRPWYKKYFWPT